MTSSVGLGSNLVSAAFFIFLRSEIVNNEPINIPRIILISRKSDKEPLNSQAKNWKSTPVVFCKANIMIRTATETAVIILAFIGSNVLNLCKVKFPF